MSSTLYCIYTEPIGDSVTRHGMQYHCHDDTHLTVERDEPTEAALAKVELDIAEVGE